MKAKKFLAVLLALALVLTMAGCSGTTTPAADAPAADAPAADAPAADTPAEEPAADAPAADGEVVEMKFTWWGSDVRHEATEKMTRLYCEQNPNIKITTEYSAWDGYWEKMAVLAASSSMPDVFQMDAAKIATFIEQNQLADLTDVLDLSGILDENLIENYKTNGKLYGAPVGANGTGIVYLKEDLAQYGISEPQIGWTWDDMIAWARDAKTKLPEGVWPMGDGRGRYEGYQNYISSVYGYKTLQNDSFNFNPEHFKEYYNLYGQLAEEGVVPPAEVSMSFVELDPLSDSLSSGKVLLRQINVANIEALANMVPDKELGMVNYPQGAVGAGWCQSTMFYCVGANSKYIPQAADFIYYILSDVEAGKILSTVRGMPVSQEVYAAIEPDLTANQRLGMELNKVINNDVVTGLPYWDDVPAAFASWDSEFKACAEAIMLGEMTIDEAAEYLDTIGKQVASTLK